MAEDINKVLLVGRLTREAELTYTGSGAALCKFSLAVNRRRKQGDHWIDEVNFFDIHLWGKRGESLHPYLSKGTQLAVEGQLRQERWNQDGVNRSRVSIEGINIQLLGNGQNNRGVATGHNVNGSLNRSQGNDRRGSGKGSARQEQRQPYDSYTPPSQGGSDYEMGIF